MIDIDTLAIPEMMNAVRLHEPRGPEGIRFEQLKTPRPGAGEVLIRVYAAGITRDELEWPVNRLPAIPSYEFSGVVAGVGSGVNNVQIGDAVYALGDFDRDGAAAEYAVVRSQILAPKPQTLNYVESAAIPLAALTAWQGLFDHGNLEKGQRVLIHGATGGVGHFAVQLARWRGAHIIGTASPRSIETARRLGAHEIIDYTSQRFEDVAGQVDLVFDTAGGERLARSPSVVRPSGRLVSVAGEPPQARATAAGITAVYFVVKPDREQLVKVAQLADSGELRPVVSELFSLAHARQAFERSLSRQGAGKIVLRIAGQQ